MKNCGNCVHWKLSDLFDNSDTAELGECQRFPPVLMSWVYNGDEVIENWNRESNTKFPITSNIVCCGEYKVMSLNE